jgi:hypothetical protein
MDQADAEVLERIAAGEHVFRPSGSVFSPRWFEVLVQHLRELHERGLIDMPDRSIASATEIEGGGYLMAGPCYLTEAGRAALEAYRRPERRLGERRTGDRRQRSLDDSAKQRERREEERRQGDRRQ